LLISGLSYIAVSKSSYTLLSHFSPLHIRSFDTYTSVTELCRNLWSYESYVEIKSVKNSFDDCIFLLFCVCLLFFFTGAPSPEICFIQKYYDHTNSQKENQINPVGIEMIHLLLHISDCSLLINSLGLPFFMGKRAWWRAAEMNFMARQLSRV